MSGWKALVAVALLAASAHADDGEDGARLLEAGRLVEAERVFTAQLVSTKRPGVVWFDLCLTEYAMGSFGKAINACYRALQDPAMEQRAIAMLDRIRSEVTTQRLPLDGTLPHPVVAWFDPEPAIVQRVVGDIDDSARTAPPFVLPSAATIALIADVEKLRGRAPPLPYNRPAGAQDYTQGIDLI